MKEDKDIPTWWRSEPVNVPMFENIALPFVLTIEKDVDELLKNKIETAINNFLNLNPNYRTELSDLVYENYKDMLSSSDITPLDIKVASDIWQYVHPEEVYISQRNRRDDDVYIQLTCECDWEEEHGLQLIFRQGKKLTRVSQQDGHLTESDAYGKEDSQDWLLSNF
jgi:hypothetical protein